MPSVARLAVSVVANSAAFTRGMLSAGKSVKKFGASARLASGLTKALNASMINLAKFVGVAFLARSFFRALRQQEMFQRALAQSQAIMGDLSDQMRGDMRRASIELARTTVFTAEESAKAFFFLASAGLSAEQSLKALPLAGKFAQAGMFDLSLATDLLTDAQSALGLTTDDAAENLENMTRVSDVLVKANTLANASIRQFSEALTTKAGAALKTLGKGIEEGVAALAVFADQGVKSAEAGTALQIVLRDLSTKAILNAKAFEAAGVQVFDAFGKMRNLADIVGDLERALEGASNAQAKLTLLTLGFTDKALIRQQQLIGNSENLRRYEKALLKAATATEEVAEKTITPLQKELNEVSGAWAKLTDRMGPPFLNAVTATLRGLSSLKDGLAVLLRVGFGLGAAPAAIQQAAEAATLAGVGRGQFRKPPQLGPTFGESERRTAVLVSFRKQVERAQKALAEFGVPPLVLQLQKLRQAFFDNEASIPVQTWLDGASAIEKLMRAEKALEMQTRLASRAMQDNLDVASARKALYERTRTPLEIFTRQVAALEELQSKTLLLGGDETFRREMKRLREELDFALGRNGRREFITGNLAEVAIGRKRQQGTASKPQVVKSPQLQTLITLTQRTNELIEEPRPARAE